jgi:hypothetical protein
MSRFSLAICATLLILIGAASYARPEPALPLPPDLPPLPHQIVNAPPNTKVVGLLWDGDELYVFVRPMELQDVAHDWTVLRSSPTPAERTTLTVRESRMAPTTEVSFPSTRME